MSVPTPPLNQLNPGNTTITSAGQAANAAELQNGQGNPVLGNPAYGNIAMGPSGAAVRTVSDNQTTSGQLATLMSSSSPLEQLAQSQGMNAAAARGSANGTLFAGAEQAALNQNLTPVAAQDAQVYERQAQANEDAINQQESVAKQAAGQVAAAGAYGNAIMYSSDNQAKTQAAALAQNQNQFTTNWANTIAQTKSNQAWTQQDQASQNEFALKGAVVNQAVNTIFSDPSYWNNPAGSLGMINDYTQNIGSIIDGMFPPGTFGQSATQIAPGVPNVRP